MYFSANNGTAGAEFYKTNGTAAGTVPVKDIYPGIGGSSPNYLTRVAYRGFERLYFTAFNSGTGIELYKSGGTAASTGLAKDIFPAANSSQPVNLTSFKGAVYFTANDGAIGFELFKSNGTPASTVPVKNINPGAAWSYPRDLIVVNNTLYFRADNGGGYALYKSDGTTAGTVLVKDVDP